MKLSADKILKIFEIIAGVEGAKGIAELLNASYNAVSAWKRRNKVPNAYILKFCEKFNIPEQFFEKDLEDIFCFQDDYKKEYPQPKELEEPDPIYYSFKRALSSVKKDPEKVLELEDMLDNFYKENRVI